MLNLRCLVRLNPISQSLHLLQYFLHYSTAVSAVTSTTNYLVTSLGFSHQQALSISNKLYLRRRVNKVIDSTFVENANSVVTLFKTHGLDEPHIRNIVSKHPRLLISNVDKTLIPKFRLLQDHDFSASDIIRVISTRPTILLCELDSTMLPVIQCLRQVMGSNSNVINTIERLSEVNFRNVVKCLLPNVALLRSYGVLIELIRKQLLYRPWYLLARNPEVFKGILMRVEKNLEITRDLPALHYSTNDSYANYFVDSLGFTHQQALSLSTKLSLRRRNKVIDTKFVENANSIVTLFRNLGFHQTHIRNIVSKQPRLLTSNIEKTLMPKIRALQDEDFSVSDIIRVISRCPEILVYGLESTILPAVHNLKQVMGSVASVVDTMERLRELCFSNIVNCLLPNVALLTSFGDPIESIRKHMLYQPWYLVRNPQVFKDVVMKLGTTQHSQTTASYANYFVDSLGFSRRQALFISTKLYGRRKNKVIDSKFIKNANSVVTLFHNLGFDDTLLRIIVSKEPQLLAYNVEKTLKPKMRLLQDEDFSALDVIRVISARPTILLYGLEFTMIPVIQILRQVMGSNSNVIDTIERLSETNFLKIVKCLLPNVTLLSSYGVSIELIREQLLFQPWYLVQNPKVFKDVVMKDDKKLGITRH